MKNIINWIFGLFLLVIIMLAFSCESTKHVDTSTTNTDSSALLSERNKNKELTRLLQEANKKIQQYEDFGLTFQPAPPCPQLNTDSLKAALLEGGCKQSTVDSAIREFTRVSQLYADARATIKKMADGTLIIQGQIDKVTQRLTTVTEENKKLQVDNEKISEENKDLKTQVTTLKREKEKNKESHFFSPNAITWILFVLGLAIGAFVTWKILKSKK